MRAKEDQATPLTTTDFSCSAAKDADYTLARAAFPITDSDGDALKEIRVFTPVSGWEGDATFTFRVVDAFGDVSPTRTATIKVVPVIVQITSTPEDANYGYNVGENSASS